jgi:nucleotide-binding universal stress UspA family protein
VNIRRILVALDATVAGPSGLEVLARMAARLQAELVGMFVEDRNLLRAAALPFAREIGFPSAHSRALDEAAMTRTLRALARRAERALADAAARAAVRWSFRVARGAVPAELLEAAAAADLLVLERAGRAGGGLGSTARQLLENTTATVLVLRQGAELRSPVVAWIESETDVERVLSVAEVVAGTEVPVACLAGGSPPACARLRSDCRARAGARSRAIAFELLDSTMAVQQARAALPARAGVLVLGQDSQWLRDGGMDWLVAVPCPVLLVGLPGA